MIKKKITDGQIKFVDTVEDTDSAKRGFLNAATDFYYKILNAPMFLQKEAGDKLRPIVLDRLIQIEFDCVFKPVFEHIDKHYKENPEATIIEIVSSVNKNMIRNKEFIEEMEKKRKDLLSNLNYIFKFGVKMDSLTGRLRGLAFLRSNLHLVGYRDYNGQRLSIHLKSNVQIANPKKILEMVDPLTSCIDVGKFISDKNVQNGVISGGIPQISLSASIGSEKSYNVKIGINNKEIETVGLLLSPEQSANTDIGELISMSL